MERYGAKRLEFSGAPVGAPPVILKNKDGVWKTETASLEIPHEKVQDVLDKLSGNRIKDFLTGAAIPTGEAEGLKITLGDEKIEAKRQWAFWKQGEKIYSRDLLSKRKEAFEVDSALKDALPWTRAFFQKPAPIPSATPSAAPKK